MLAESKEGRVEQLANANEFEAKAGVAIAEVQFANGNAKDVNYGKFGAGWGELRGATTMAAEVRADLEGARNVKATTDTIRIATGEAR
jgi:hypothetical protein